MLKLLLNIIHNFRTKPIEIKVGAIYDLCKKKNKTTSFFARDDFKREKLRAKKFFQQPYNLRAQERFHFWQPQEELISELQKLFNNKCCYCENTGVPMSIDHFRPRDGALSLNGELSSDCYWWLAYEWSNLYYVCVECSANKRNLFPISGNRARPTATGKELILENPLLIDPCNENPGEHLGFDENGKVFSSSDKGIATIEVLDLNRENLLIRRKEHSDKLRKYWDDFLTYEAEGEYHIFSFLNEDFRKIERILLDEITNQNTPFLAMKQQLVKRLFNQLPKPRFLKNKIFFRSDFAKAVKKLKIGSIKKLYMSSEVHQEIDELYNIEENKKSIGYYIKRHLIKRVIIKNFRAIKFLDIKIDSKEKTPCLMILGENGTGKSSFLQAIALALMNSRDRERVFNDYDPSKFLSGEEEEGSILILLSGISKPFIIRFNREGIISLDDSRNNNESKVVLLGYGCSRITDPNGVEKSLPDCSTQVDNLFYPYKSGLGSSNDRLCSFDEDNFNNAVKDLRSLLMLEEPCTFMRRDKTVLVNMPETTVKLNNLSDGYQSVIALVVDIMVSMRNLWQDFRMAEGIVMVDEIDAHLHPRWKMQIVSKLREVFPRIQFIFTSHDPLCLRGMADGEVIVMRKDNNNAVYLLEDLPPHEGLRVDQILTSEYFGINCTTDPHVEASFNEYYTLLANPDSRNSSRVNELKDELQKYNLLGETRRERLMYEAIDEFLAMEKFGEEKKNMQPLKEETKRKLVEIWKTFGFEESAND